MTVLSKVAKLSLAGTSMAGVHGGSAKSHTIEIDRSHRAVVEELLLFQAGATITDAQVHAVDKIKKANDMLRKRLQFLVSSERKDKMAHKNHNSWKVLS